MTTVDRMATRLTLPFQRGADRLPLQLLVADTGPQRAGIVPYDFSEHFARFEAVADPRYLLTARYDVREAVTLSFTCTDAAGGTHTVAATVPAGTLAGTSVLLDLGGLEGPGTRLTGFTMAPAPPSGTPVAAERWELRALLGELGRLLWVVGGGRDELRTQAGQVRRLTRLPDATGLTLDLIGYDLAVPRFPPLPYAFEDGTVALYHADEAPSSATIADAMTLYGGAGHPGTVTAAQTGAVGRFGRGLAFTVPAAEISVPDHADFAVGATTSFTAECFVRPGEGTWEGAVLGKHPNPATLTARGWAISVGGFNRGIPRSVRFLLGDGTNSVVLFADQTLPTERFSHLAGVVDRAAGQARLYVDGVLRASRPLGPLGTLTNANPVRIGRADSSAAAVFRGIVDEVRLSRAARTAFPPVLGEGDDGYRRRLRLFQRWRLPTPEGVSEALNEAVGPIQGVERPLVVEDTDARLTAAGRPLRVLPDDLPIGGSIDDAGRRGVTEAEVNGVPEDDDEFDPALLVDASDALVDFFPPFDGSPPPNRMRVATRRALTNLLDLITNSGAHGQLGVALGYPPNPILPGSDRELFAVGRKLVFTHESVPVGRLAALAHQAGFTWVSVAAPLEEGDAGVFASVRSTETLEITVNPAGGTATPQLGFDLLNGQTLPVGVAPQLPLRAQVRWFVISAGAVRADFTGRTDQASAVLTARQPGEVVVGVQVTLGTRAFRATRRLRIGIATLASGQSIASTGQLGADASVAGSPDVDSFAPAYLDTVQDTRLDFASGANNRRMTSVLSGRLLRLVGLLFGAGTTGRLLVSSAWQPNGSGLEREGRALTLERGTLSIAVDRLGAFAHAAGFTHVASDGTRLRILQAAGDPLQITGEPQVAEGDTVEWRVRQAARPQGALLAGGVLYTANTDTDSVSAINPATGEIDHVFKVGVAPVALAAGADGNIYSADRDGGTITVINVSSGAVAATINVGVGSGGPIDLVRHPTQARLFVACLDGRLIQIDASTFTVLNTLSVGTSAAALDLHVSGNRLWVAASGSQVRVVNTQNFTIANTVNLTGAPRDIVVGASVAYATVPDSNALVLLTLSAPAVQATFTDLGPDPVRLALSPDGQVLYVTDAGQTRIHLRKPDGSPQTAPFPPRLSGDRAAAAIAVDNNRAYLVGARGGLGDEGAIGVLEARVSTATVDVWPLGTGHGERLTWSVRGPAGDVRLSTSTRQQVNLTGRAAGPLEVQAVYQWPGDTPPYIFAVRLDEALDDDVVIRKDQYDLIMNVLSELHPIGVEVDTRAVRERVVEVRDALLDVFPGYTFPDFRIRGPRPPIPDLNRP